MFLLNQIRFFLPAVFFLLPLKQIFAQSSPDDSLSLAKTVNNTLSIYFQSAGDQSRLYNGTEYTGYPFNFAEGSPFFLTNQPQKGSVMYDGVEYRDVNLQYDELSDKIIMQDENHRIQLSNERISRFAIGNNQFVSIVNDSLDPSAPATGFYNILYEGNPAVLKKEIKSIRQIYSYSQEATRLIDVKTNYYFRKNNQYTRIDNQKELLNFFPDRKKEIQHYIKTNKLGFKKDPDNLLVKVAVYYDQQTK
jgi:hypothetical protein